MNVRDYLSCHCSLVFSRGLALSEVIHHLVKYTKPELKRGVASKLGTININQRLKADVYFTLDKDWNTCFSELIDALGSY